MRVTACWKEMGDEGQAKREMAHAVRQAAVWRKESPLPVPETAKARMEGCEGVGLEWGRRGAA